MQLAIVLQYHKHAKQNGKQAVICNTNCIIQCMTLMQPSIARVRHTEYALFSLYPRLAGAYAQEGGVGPMVESKRETLPRPVFGTATRDTQSKVTSQLVALAPQHVGPMSKSLISFQSTIHAIFGCLPV
jgi:hypothetical protein